MLIFLKAYKYIESFELGYLKAPSDHFSNATRTMYRVFDKSFSSEPHRVKLGEHLGSSIENITPAFAQLREVVANTANT